MSRDVFCVIVFSHQFQRWAYFLGQLGLQKGSKQTVHSSILRVLMILQRVRNPWDADVLSFGAPSCSLYTPRKTLEEQRKETLRKL